MEFRSGSFVISNPEYFYLIIPLIIILSLILRRRFIREDQRLVVRKGKKRTIFLMKLLFFMLVLAAMSGPYIEDKETQGNVTRLKVLIDGSKSMELYDTESVLSTIESVKKEGISVNVIKLDLQESSSIGNSILNNLAPGENILLVSDGQNNFGPSLEDVSLFASTIDSKLFGVNLGLEEEDARIIIEGPSKVVSGVENEFLVKVLEAGNIGKKAVKVSVDGEIIYDARYEKEISIKKIFRAGSHIIKAELDSEDLFPENNIYYKTLMVYEKPSVLFVSKKISPLMDLYAPFYDVKVSETIPSSLDKYYAVLLNDINEQDLPDEVIADLEDFVSDGNGLYVIGGKESYDWGDYNISLISNILPVSIGKANKKKDITNVMLLMDTGASGQDTLIDGVTYFDVQKALAADIVKSLVSTNRIGMVEANYYLNTVSGLSEAGPKKSQMINDIGLLKPHGLSELRFAYQKAYEMLKLAKGSKNIVIITDGKLVPADQSLTLKLVSDAYDDGIKTFIIGVGDNADETFLQSIKEQGGGEYFRTDEKNRIQLYFGDPSNAKNDELKMFVYDSNHFITQNLKELGRIYGFNSVYPKATARLLITTSAGDPVLTIWNYGLGRVASLTTDDGTTWVPELLKGENSKSLIRTLNWLIEDPERKSSLIIDAPELRLGENAQIVVKSGSMPKSDALSFYESEKGIFRTNYYPDETGIVNLLGMPFAVNYKKEYLNLGISGDFQRVLSISGGEMLDNDAGMIAEKIKAVAAVSMTKKTGLEWLFIIAAIAVYLIELYIRRIYELKSQQ